jgi:hypothetical protein
MNSESAPLIVSLLHAWITWEVRLTESRVVWFTETRADKLELLAERESEHGEHPFKFIVRVTDTVNQSAIRADNHSRLTQQRCRPGRRIASTLDSGLVRAGMREGTSA